MGEHMESDQSNAPQGVQEALDIAEAAWNDGEPEPLNERQRAVLSVLESWERKLAEETMARVQNILHLARKQATGALSAEEAQELTHLREQRRAWGMAIAEARARIMTLPARPAMGEELTEQLTLLGEPAAVLVLFRAINGVPEVQLVEVRRAD
jgi:hypothetical protein